MKLFTRTLFFFLLVTQICFAQWYQQNSGTTKNLNAVNFSDANNGWVVGDSGIILHTTTAGETWVQQTSSTTSNLKDVQFIDAYTGWIASAGYPNESVVLKTTNSGADWFQQMSWIGLELYSICFIEENIGWIVGWSGSDVILKTTDGGTNWVNQSSPTAVGLNDIHFVDVNTGFIAGGYGHSKMNTHSGSVLKTTNGGDTWNEQLVVTEIHWNGIAFSDPLNGIVVGDSCGFSLDGEIFQTTDGGINWLGVFKNPFGNLRDITIVDSIYAWAVGARFNEGGAILFSSDKGTNWSFQAVESDGLQSVYFINPTTGWAVGYNGTIIHTTNGGATFVEEEQINEMPTEFLLSNNFPNPFNPSTKIKYTVVQTSQVQIKVFDVLGNEISTLVNEEKPAGAYELNWNAVNLPSGVYFYQLRSGDFVETRKMVLMK
jgi:photosystem II stability/assembly factor-like uncharacterized protein